MKIHLNTSLFDHSLTLFGADCMYQLQRLEVTANSQFYGVFLAICSRLQIVISTFIGYLQSTANSHFNVFLAIEKKNSDQVI